MLNDEKAFSLSPKHGLGPPDTTDQKTPKFYTAEQLCDERLRPPEAVFPSADARLEKFRER